MSSVGFIGLGVMGREMATHLLRAGHEVRAHDTRPEAGEELARQGAVVARSIAAAAEGADIVITMLPDTPHVEEVVLGPDGLLHNPPGRRLLVDMSTISPTATRRMAAELASAGIAMLDAPVSGGPAGAKAAKLSIMVGGPEEAVARARPVLEAMGTRIVHVGESGAGQTVKACNQLVCAMSYLRGARARARGGARPRQAARRAARRRSVVVDAAESRTADPGQGRLGGVPDRPEAQGSAPRGRARVRTRRPTTRDGARDEPLPGSARTRGMREPQLALFRVYDRLSNQADTAEKEK